MVFLRFVNLLEELTEHSKSLHAGLKARTRMALSGPLGFPHSAGLITSSRPWCTMRSRLTWEVPQVFSAPSFYLGLEDILIFCDLHPPGISKPFPSSSSGGQSCCIVLKVPFTWHLGQSFQADIDTPIRKDIRPEGHPRQRPYLSVGLIYLDYTAACSEHSESSFCLHDRALLAMGLGLGHRLQ